MRHPTPGCLHEPLLCQEPLAASTGQDPAAAFWSHSALVLELCLSPAPVEHKEGIHVGHWELTASLPRAVISSQARCHRAPCSSWSEDAGQRQLLFCLGFNSCRAVVWLFCLETIILPRVSRVSLLKALTPRALQAQEPPHWPQPHNTFLSEFLPEDCSPLG